MENSQLPGHSNLLANPGKLKTNDLVTILLANHGKLEILAIRTLIGKSWKNSITCTLDLWKITLLLSLDNPFKTWLSRPLSKSLDMDIFSKWAFSIFLFRE